MDKHFDKGEISIVQENVQEDDQDDQDGWDFNDLDEPAQVAVTCLQDYICPWQTKPDVLLNALCGKEAIEPWAYFWAISTVAMALSISVSFLLIYFLYLSERGTSQASPLLP